MPFATNDLIQYVGTGGQCRGINYTALKTALNIAVPHSIWQGTWQSGVAYLAGDMVLDYSSGFPYQALHDVSSTNFPRYDSPNWQVLRGIDGSNGNNGNNGTDARQIWQGTWQNGGSYLAGDIVYDANASSTFECLASGIYYTPPNQDATNWIPLRGSVGSNGTNGTNGDSIFAVDGVGSPSLPGNDTNPSPTLKFFTYAGGTQYNEVSLGANFGVNIGSLRGFFFYEDDNCTSLDVAFGRTGHSKELGVQQGYPGSESYGYLALAKLRYSPLTTSARDALTPTEGDTIYNGTLQKLQIYTGSAWETITSS
jgi:hypothetical protein